MHAHPSIPTESELEESLRTTWNARVVDYDGERFPFADRILEAIRGHGYAVETLATLHEVVPRDEVYALSKLLCEDTNQPDFRRMVDDFALEEIAPKGDLVPPIAAQRFLNVRIMWPDKPQGVFPFHTGLLYGHGRGSRSLWLPLTDQTRAEDRSASLQIIELVRSRDLIRHAMSNELSLPEMTELFGSESTTVRAGPGQVLMFTQENIHGNFVNRTGKTRVSIDFRLAEARYGDQLARKIPGGYFEVVTPRGREVYRPDHSSLANGRPNVIYLNNNTASTERVPAHLQRCMVYDYCKKHGLPYDFELFELEQMSHLPTLMHLVDELECNPILYSIYALPEAPDRRAELYAKARAKGVFLFFVNEDLALADGRDQERIEQFLGFCGYGQ
jgi:sporadic carbohydrate cluster protein (TIGR04323 family)